MTKLPDIYEVANNMLTRKLQNFGGRTDIAPTIVSILDDFKNFRVEYHISGDFTTAILLSNKGEVFSGTSKRSRRDKSNPFTGRSWALTRALNQLIVKRIGIDNSPNHFVIK